LKSSPEQADAASTHFRHRVRTLRGCLYGISL
jgi:hypothetical protein